MIGNTGRNWRLAVLAVALLTALLLAVIFVQTGRHSADGLLLMPLDDVYIHFQYARQMAAGQPYVYNPGLPPTSGATSFLYPFLLAAGHAVGFQGLSLGYWALALGSVALFAGILTVYAIVRAGGGGRVLSLIAGLLFAITGPVAWHYFSGMETGIAMTLTLLLVYGYVVRRLGVFVLAASLLALTRPEGGFVAIFALALYGLRQITARRKPPLLLIVPVLALLVQPLVNALITGTAVASGNQSKSILASVPFDMTAVISRFLENFGRMWLEFITGSSAPYGIIWTPLLVALAAVGAVYMISRRQMRWTGLLILGAFLIMTAAIATLDTAFWHFKRYQMPLLALAFPAVFILLAKISPRQVRRIVTAGVALALLISGVTLLLRFVDLHRTNVRYVYEQPYQMAQWLQANTPEDALVAVHDVGAMRYIGQRTTLDIVGLTTPGAATYWRNGPGSVGELLLKHQPDYIANYGFGHGYGLRMLAETSLYDNEQAQFSVELDAAKNVALAADTQGIYEPDWAAILCDEMLLPPENMTVRESTFIDVADIASEAAADYVWRVEGELTGFPTEFLQFAAVDCPLMDGVRVINGEESFTVQRGAGEDLLILTRLHPLATGTLSVLVDGQAVATRVIPVLAGQWLTIPTLIPAERMQGDTVRVTVQPDVDGYYYPASHTIYTGDYKVEMSPDNVTARYQDGALSLVDYRVNVSDDTIGVQLDWYATSQIAGDYRLFVHLYDDIQREPVAQFDGYAGNNTQPLGNWLPGNHRDTITLPNDGLPEGTYTLMIGFYQPVTGERLAPLTDADENIIDNRLLLQTVEIAAHDE